MKSISDCYAKRFSSSSNRTNSSAYAHIHRGPPSNISVSQNLFYLFLCNLSGTDLSYSKGIGRFPATSLRDAYPRIIFKT